MEQHSLKRLIFSFCLLIPFFAFVNTAPFSSFNPANLALLGSQLNAIGNTSQTVECANAFKNILNVPEVPTNETQQLTPSPLQVIFISSGKAINDLGNYKYCIGSHNNLTYALVNITSVSNSFNTIEMGLCVPNVCGSD